MKDQRAILVASFLLFISAVFTFLYGSIVPFLPGLLDRPEPLGAAILAAVSLVAAVGVWRQQSWGRPLGIAIGAILLVRDVSFVFTGRPIEVVSVLLDVVLLYVLIRGAWGLPERKSRP
jgi:hypothetical protein